MNLKKFAFTLSELLITLSVIGVISALVVPAIVKNVNNRAQVTMLRNFVSNIQQLANEQLIAHRTRNLALTDFADPAKLLSADNFSIAKTYASMNDSGVWDNDANVSYYSIDGAKISSDDLKYYCTSFSAISSATVKLKNGNMVSYCYFPPEQNNAVGTKDKVIGSFMIDINGTDKPNVSGRDFFAFYITKKGQVVNVGSFQSTPESDCNEGWADACYMLVEENNWNMDY